MRTISVYSLIVNTCPLTTATLKTSYSGE